MTKLLSFGFNLTQNPTGLAIFIAIIALGIYDFFVVVVLRNKIPSVSEFFNGKGLRINVIDIVIGICIGHLFFNMPCVCN